MVLAAPQRYDACPFFNRTDAMLLFVDNLINVDFSYLHPERGMLGETWLASTALDGALDAQGMVCDFGDVKKRIRHFLDTSIDHCLLVPALSANLTLVEQGEDIELTWRYSNGRTLRCRSPKQAIILIDTTEITRDSVARWCVDQLKPQFAASIASLTLSFAEESIDGAFYHYSHGLKKHGGNCQRIAHGHRSRIGIWRNGARDHALEQDWANRWQDIYLGSDEDLVAEGELLKFKYRSQQGDFELDMPASQCYMLDTDTTVEWLATHIANTLAHECPGDTIKVQAFEGLHKGAIVESKV